MKNSSQIDKSPTRRRSFRLSLGAALALIAGVGVATFYGMSMYFANRAEEVARPLESAIVNVGGVKLCATGDSGRGPDNTSPHYGASYKLNFGKDRAIQLINSVAKQNGYTLTHATPSNKGHLGSVADQFIDGWYFDDESKRNPYNDIEGGSIRLSFVVYGEGEKESCSQTIIEPSHSVVGIGVQLPSFRR